MEKKIDLFPRASGLVKCHFFVVGKFFQTNFGALPNFTKIKEKAKVHLFACLSASMIDEFTDEKKKEREPKDAFIKKEMVVLSRNSESSYTCPSELVSRLFREFLTCF